MTASRPLSRLNSRKRRKLRERRTQEALRLAEEALLAHSKWCGYRRDAPGDGIYNRALRAVREARVV